MNRSTAVSGILIALGIPILGAAVGVPVLADHSWEAPRNAPAPIPEIDYNDNRIPAGNLSVGVLELDLDVVHGMWYVLGRDRVGGETLAFAESGRAPTIPGPMIRVPRGTEMRVRVTNPLTVDLVVHGLSSRRVSSLDSLVVPAGKTREARFDADSEGTFYYWAAVAGTAYLDRLFQDATLTGAFVVDPPDEPYLESDLSDRVFVMGTWYGGRDEEGNPDDSRAILTINGRPWPLTERLTYAMGDSVTWRVINASERTHPMHLHGFFFQVDSRGDMSRDTLYWPAQQRMAVTERMEAGSTMAITWSPDRPGGWVFHCHLNWHVSPNGSLEADRPTVDEMGERIFRGTSHGDPNNHVVEGMGGLMLGFYVQPPEGWTPNEPKRRQLRLFVHSDSLPGEWRPRFGYVLQGGDAEPALDSVPIPGSPIVLWEGEPTAITTINRTSEPTQVHWHGLEIESYFDGVPGVGGYPGRTTPAIAPGDSFEIRITPPRAGSYMYHTHVNDVRQQGNGLYAPFIVLEAGQRWDPETDRILMISNGADFQVLLNGSTEPEETEFRVGESYRLRLMNITIQNGNLKVRLTNNGMPVRWTRLAKDGWDVPDHQRVSIAAEQTVSIGDTYDFEFVPRHPGPLQLEVRAGGGFLFVSQPIRVTESSSGESTPGGSSPDPR